MGELIVVFPADFTSNPDGLRRRDIYFRTLQSIPDRVFAAGVVRLIAQWKPRGRVGFPFPAEIRDYCELEAKRLEEEDRKRRPMIEESPEARRQRIAEGLKLLKAVAEKLDGKAEPKPVLPVIDETRPVRDLTPEEIVKLEQRRELLRRQAEIVSANAAKD